jgi:hypothetical protein
MSTKIKVKRGLHINLPTEADEGELLATTDTNKLFMGQGAGFPLLNMSGSTPITTIRYEIGVPSAGSYVLATGKVGDVSLSIVGNVATLTAINGAIIFSASIKFSITNMAGVTVAVIDFGTSVASAETYTGTGNNSDYTNLNPPIFSVYGDAGTRAWKPTVSGILGSSASPTPHTLTLSNLVSGQAIWVRLAF